MGFAEEWNKKVIEMARRAREDEVRCTETHISSPSTTEDSQQGQDTQRTRMRRMPTSWKSSRQGNGGEYHENRKTGNTYQS